MNREYPGLALARAVATVEYVASMRRTTPYVTHVPYVTVSRRARDWFARRYWVRCWFCNAVYGPFVNHDAANQYAREVGRMRGCRED